MGDLMNTTLELYADPACPWSWLAVRWLTEVAPRRGVRLTFRSYSLWMRDGDRPPDGVPSFVREIAVAASKQSLRVLRIFEALRDAGRDDAIEQLYLAWGTRVFVPGPPQPPTTAVLEDALAAAGLASSWLAEADNPRWDAALEDSNTQLAALSRNAPVVPTLADGPNVLFRGAVLSEPVPPVRGLELWDALATLTADPAFNLVDNSRGGTPTSVMLMQ
ncbi:DsbA family protein [Kribbella sp. NPDC003557]|uniref:DsbA family protein n=1 Tax=Kribbella sp. NPDC003557 TaxID=3154449 RepID=UPI0033B03FC8